MRARRIGTGAGGALLLVALFLPWAASGGVDRTGWELWTMADVFLLIVGVVALLTALTGGRRGVFRPDVSLIGAADLLSVVASVLLGWLLLFDFPHGATREAGAYLALTATLLIAGAAGDYSTLHGAPLFPRLRDPD
jgi:hypothetical protein